MTQRDYRTAQRFANRQGFTIRCRPTLDEGYLVCSMGSRIPAFVGTLRECQVWILGYCWNRGVR
jgi:hypothetical protein